MHKGLMLLITLLMPLFANTAFAHNIVGGVYAIGSLIEGEVGFSDGEMAPPGSPIVITDTEGNLIANIKVEEEGLFSFEAKRRIDHFFVIDLGSGHVLKTHLPADELPDNLAGADAAPALASNMTNGSTAMASSTLNGTDAAALQALIERSVSKQIKPLRKELQAYKEKAGLQDILGGIGYIFGLCGIGIWIRQKKLEKQG
jgi:hypothetical protein